MNIPNLIRDHSTMEIIKIPVVIDGDLAITLLNMLHFMTEDNPEIGRRILFCDHSEPKLHKLIDILLEATDVENREER